MVQGIHLFISYSNVDQPSRAIFLDLFGLQKGPKEAKIQVLGKTLNFVFCVTI